MLSQKVQKATECHNLLSYVKFEFKDFIDIKRILNVHVQQKWLNEEGQQNLRREPKPKQFYSESKSRLSV